MHRMQPLFVPFIAWLEAWTEYIFLGYKKNDNYEVH